MFIAVKRKEDNLVIELICLDIYFTADCLELHDLFRVDGPFKKRISLSLSPEGLSHVAAPHILHLIVMSGINGRVHGVHNGGICLLTSPTQLYG